MWPFGTCIKSFAFVAKTVASNSKESTYPSAAGGRPVGQAAGRLHSPRVTERLAAPSNRMHHISINTDLFKVFFLSHCFLQLLVYFSVLVF